MRRTVLTVLLAAAALTAGASTTPRPASASAVGASAPPPVDAAAYVVIGESDGRVLAERRSAERRPVASITKLMTVLVAVERASLDELVTIPAAAVSVGESTIRLREGERVSVRELALGALVPSANDAATALALHVGRGSVARFVAMMNARARRLGLRHTTYRNPHGLDEPGHLSSARDAAALLTAALEHPFIRRNASRAAALVAGRLGRTTDRLVGRFPGLAGAKTGHTNGAGWSQVAYARRGDVGITVAVLGEPTEAGRDRDLVALLEWGFTQYVPVRLVDATRVYGTVASGWGVPPIELVAPATLTRTVAVGVPLVERGVFPAVATLPVRDGQVLGRLEVLRGGDVLVSSALVARFAVARPGRLERIRWYAGRALDTVLDVFT